MSGQTFTYTESQTLVTETCCRCGVLFAMPDYLRKACLRDHSQEFYCPNGHGQVYTGKTEAQKERKRAEKERELRERAEVRVRSVLDQLESAERSNSALRGVVTRQKNRAAAGVCPCCTRSFQNLQRHMSAKHPDYAAGGAS